MNSPGGELHPKLQPWVAVYNLGEGAVTCTGVRLKRCTSTAGSQLSLLPDSVGVNSSHPLGMSLPAAGVARIPLQRVETPYEDGDRTDGGGDRRDPRVRGDQQSLLLQHSDRGMGDHANRGGEHGPFPAARLQPTAGAVQAAG